MTGNDDATGRSGPTTTRRAVLAVAGSLAAGIAGCSSDGETPTDSPTATPTTTAPAMTPTPTATATAEPTATPTETTEGADPAARVDFFVEQLDAGNFRRAYDVLGGQAASSYRAPRHLQFFWHALTAQHGFPQSTSVRDRTSEGDSTTLRYAFDCPDGTAVFRFTVNAEGAITAMENTASYSPPAYADTSAFTERALDVPTDRPLPGTLTVPKSDGPHPGVVLVHGTGPHDRNESAGPNKPFKDLAWGLASRGVAVYRYDKRTEEYDVPPADRTLDAVTVDDAVAAARRVAREDGIDSDAVFVVGHSQGGTAAPRIASKHGGLAGVALLAGFTVPVTKLLVRQNRRLLENRDGTLSSRDESRVQRIERVMTKVENRAYDPGRRIGNLSAALLYSLLDYDQVAAAESLSIPAFVAQGERDWQVGMKNYRQWRDALPDESTRGERYPGVNHFFQYGKRPSTNMEYTFFDNVDESLVGDLASWVTATVEGD